VATLRAATTAASSVLSDNGLAPKAEAQRFAAELGGAGTGVTLRHEASGYAFRIKQDS